MRGITRGEGRAADGAAGYARAMTNDERDHVPAVTGVQPDAPNAADPERHDLAMGPPATDETVDVHPADERP